MSDLMLTFIPFKNFGVIQNRVEAGAGAAGTGAASKFSLRARAA
jgi:hypothetical protein